VTAIIRTAVFLARVYWATKETLFGYYSHSENRVERTEE
jgi:hypothetical protein